MNYTDRIFPTNKGLTTYLDELIAKNYQIPTFQREVVWEEISNDLFHKYTEKYRAEKLELEKNLLRTPKRVSNLEECVEKALNLSSKLATEWASGGYALKQKIQNLIFPEGITYNKRNNECRTPRINWVFALIARLRQDFMNEKIGIPELNVSYADLVAGSRIELPTLGL